ncbi:MFS general substrate transporter [Polyplosphaeria fusca]|uniref:MFS general substrate transporter n=1 Tax=Polyplosphaeria fusca TaxID=682080 RepID=A0A9P4V3H9_9PLEO|nr:MFS general substrate transporter [Polyplosphaeria fusca]
MVEKSEDVEKGGKTALYGRYLGAGLMEDDAWFLCRFSKAEDRAIYRKVDCRVVPMLAMLYLISHLDRANLGNAKIEGLEKDLGMDGNMYNIVVSVFFVPYILLEIPSNMLLAKFKRPSIYIGTLVTCWGLVVTFSGLTQSFAGLCVSRFLVGVFEAGFFPAAVWLISMWYPPNRTGGRTSIFYVSSAASGAFSGLLAAGIAQLHGSAGQEGWRWIFIIEGIVSVLFGISTFFFLPDTPSLTSRWLNEDERRYLVLMNQATRGSNAARTAGNDVEEAKRFDWKAIRAMLTDHHIYLQAIVFSSNAIPNNGMKYTMPQIVRNMGYESTTAQLMSAPPYVCGAIATVLSGIYADKRGNRMKPIVFFQVCVLVSMAVLFRYAPNIEDNIALCYTMVIIVCIGVYPIVPACNTWCLNNLAGAEKRVSGVAFLVTMGNTGGFIGSWVFLNTESPSYPTGFGTSLSIAGAGIMCAFLLEWLYSRHNKRWEGYTREEVEEQYTPQQLHDMGDRSPLFKYGL